MTNALVAERIRARYHASEADVLRGISLHLAEGEHLGLSGASGAGKSTLLRLCAGLYRLEQLLEVEGSLSYGGQLDLLHGPDSHRLAFRRDTVGLLTEDPTAGFHPQQRIGKQWEKCGHRERLPDKLAALGLDPNAQFEARLPHELSGGEAQRIRLAFALARSPQLLLLESPTSALDQPNTERVLAAIAAHRDRSGTAVFHVDHDHLLLAQLSSRRVHLQDGCLGDLPAVVPLQLPPKPSLGPPILRVKALTITYGSVSQTRIEAPPFDLREGEALCLLGPSGSGKTSMGKALARLVPAEGEVQLIRNGQWAQHPLARARYDKAIPALQYIWQEPRRSLNPAFTVAETLRSAGCPKPQLQDLLARVALTPTYLARRVLTLSTGEMQRLAIARALAPQPRVLVCDEITAGLDPETTRTVLEQLVLAQAEQGLAVLFITHDRSLAEAYGHRLLELGA